jgi:GT2 family glycosyltransferase
MDPLAQTRVLAVVVNYNAGDFLIDSVRSLLRQGPSMQVVVLDNQSTDGSDRAVEEHFGGDSRFSIRRESRNFGFAGGVNRAVEWVRAQPGPQPEYLLIVNPDCELAEGAVGCLVDALQAHPRSGIAGPLVQDAQGRVQRATVRRFPDPWLALRTFSGLQGGVDQSADLPLQAQEVEAVSGACMMLAFGLWRRLGGLDAAYAMHCEDLDLMYRARQAGYHCLFVPEARVVHHQGQSSRSRPAWVHWQKHRGMQRFFGKFQREQYSLPVRWLVSLGIWARYLVTLPFQWRRR